MTRRNPNAVIPMVHHDRQDEDAYFQAIQARMSEKSQRVIEALRSVRSVYVECGRDTALSVGFERFLERYLAARNEIHDEADIYLLTGESGAGKSAAIGRLLRTHPALQTLDTSYGRIVPYVSIKLKGYGLPRLVAARIIRKAGYGQVRGSGQGEMWDGLNEALRAQRVFLVHIDEAQHLLRANATEGERKELANAIKGASIDPDWPIAFVLSGLPNIVGLPRDDGQVERRGAFTHFNDVRMPDEADLVGHIVREMAKPVDLDVADLLQSDFTARLAHAAANRYARVCQLTLSAIQEALHKNRTTLTLNDFVKAYERRSLTLGRLDKNPFHVEDYKSLLPGSFLELPEDEPEADE